MFPKNGVQRNSPSLLGFGKCSSGVAQIHGILCRFQSTEVIGGHDRGNRLAVTFDDHAFAAVLGAAQHVGKVVLCIGDGHGGHVAIMAYLARRDR
ncbi:MAG TPA: hypothetical protein VNJ04_12190 [Gemmatimonadaceae bacterium]|nr:hypothetical protein [Gemmatimonadaceae bacterium]